MQQILDYFQRIDDCILSIMLSGFPITVLVKVVGEINKELFIEVVERTDRHFPLLVVIFQTPQRSEVGSLGTCLLYTSPSPRD